MVKNMPVMQETQVWFLGGEDPLEKGMATTPVFLPENSMDRGALMGSQRVRHDWVTKHSTACSYTRICTHTVGVPGGSVVKNPPADAGNTGDAGSASGWGLFPGEENDNPLQFSCLGNPMDRRAWWAAVRGVAKELGTTKHAHTHCMHYNISHFLCNYWAKIHHRRSRVIILLIHFNYFTH